MQDPSSVVIIVGAGPAGLATASCLTVNSIPYILLEREDCSASLWKKYSYDRLHLHLTKQFSNLPHFPLPPSTPTYVPKDLFIKYLDDYAAHFNITPLYQRRVVHAEYDEESKKWVVKATNVGSGDQATEEYYSGGFLVVASGEACDPFVPEIEGLDTFPAGEVFHSTKYRNGKAFSGKNVLVVGSGNSGMEIALDLSDHGARTSIVVRSPIHILSRGMVSLALNLLKHFPLGIVDWLLVILSKLRYGNGGELTKLGLTRPKEGPFFMKVAYGKYPIIDVGTYNKIKSGEIQVLPAIDRIRGDEVVLENGKSCSFDTLVFCTGFKRSTNKWLQGGDYLLNEDGISKQKYPNHWKGKDGLYACGLSRRGLYAINEDALNIAKDILHKIQLITKTHH